MPILYKIFEDHASVQGHIGSAKDIIIPRFVHGCVPVTEISDHAFEDKICLERVILLGEDVKRIGEGAFRGCKKLHCFGHPEDQFLVELLEVLVMLTGETQDLSSLLLDCEEDIICSIPMNLSVGTDAFKGTPLEQLFRPLSDEKNP